MVKKRTIATVDLSSLRDIIWPENSVKQLKSFHTNHLDVPRRTTIYIGLLLNILMTDKKMDNIFYLMGITVI